MPEQMNAALLLVALDMTLERNAAEGDGPPVVAVTPHGSFTFAVEATSYDGERVVLHLREIDRATDRSA